MEDLHLPLSPASGRSPPAHRRRDKPQLSCDPCRKRKSKCDRVTPCSVCLKRGTASTCQYPTARAPRKPPSSRSGPRANAGGLRQRLNTLESQIVSLIQETGADPNGTPHLAKTNRELGVAPEGVRVDADGTRQHNQHRIKAGNLSTSPAASTYVTGTHWVAILDSIAELKEQVEFEKGITPAELDDDEATQDVERPALLFGYQGSSSKEALIDSMPERSVVDRLVSQYFNDLDMMSHVPCLHTATFLRQYDRFWENPRNVCITWLRLLYSMMCLSTYFGPSSFPAQPNPDSPDPRLPRRPLYLEQVVQCLGLGKYSRGGPFVLEALIHYFMIEYLRRPDTEVDVWLLLGVLLRLALRGGYHRDPSQFDTITPFEGEMRRRIWAALYSADAMISMKVGVPRMLQDSQSDTRPPRNLLDSDFDEGCSELPPSRNENDVAPIFYILARYKMSKVMGIMMDIINPYST